MVAARQVKARYYFLSQNPDAKKILDKLIHWIDNNSVKNILKLCSFNWYFV